MLKRICDPMLNNHWLNPNEGRWAGRVNGMEQHNRHTIITRTWDLRKAQDARNKAIEIFGSIEGGIEPSPILVSATDDFTFFIPFKTSDKGCAAQDAYIRWLEEQHNGDGSRVYSWAA